MRPHFKPLNRRDLRASLFAAAATLLTILLNGPDPQFDRAGPRSSDDSALRGLIPAAQAQSEGAWLLDQPGAQARLSFAPQHDRLVWRVEGGEAQVLIDAQTGEPLEFLFE